MRSWTIALALLVCACGDREDFDGSEDTDLDPVADVDDGSLIPEVGETLRPMRTEHSLSEAFADEDEISAPDYDRLRGDKVRESKRDGWVLRSSGESDAGSRSRRGGGGLVTRLESAAPSSAAPPHELAMDDATVAYEVAASGRESKRGPTLDVPYVAQASPLKAGTTDDNEAFGEYLEFLATWTDRAGMAGQYIRTDVHEREYIRVVDADGTPLPGARVRVAGDGAILQSGATYGDGTVPFYPRLSLDGTSRSAPRDGYAVEVTYQGERQVLPWDADVPLVVQLERDVPMEAAVPMDVVFLIDTTGSMSDEIARIKSTLLSVTQQLQSQERPVELRYGAVLYRDIGDEYVTKRHAFTKDIQSFDSALQGIQANGGGDGPESLNQGMAEAVHAMEWRHNSAKLVFLVADAPPHMDYQGDVPYAQTAMAAVDKGIRVHTVAASGLDSYGGVGSLVYRQTAQLTQGKFIFIEYGSTAASAASHGVTGPVKSNNLDDIIYEQVQAELQGWRQPGALVASR